MSLILHYRISETFEMQSPFGTNHKDEKEGLKEVLRLAKHSNVTAAFLDFDPVKSAQTQKLSTVEMHHEQMNLDSVVGSDLVQTLGHCLISDTVFLRLVNLVEEKTPNERFQPERIC